MNIPTPSEYYNHCYKRKRPATEKQYMKIIYRVIKEKTSKIAVKEVSKSNSFAELKNINPKGL